MKTEIFPNDFNEVIKKKILYFFSTTGFELNKFIEENLNENFLEEIPEEILEKEIPKDPQEIPEECQKIFKRKRYYRKIYERKQRQKLKNLLFEFNEIVHEKYVKIHKVSLLEKGVNIILFLKNKEKILIKKKKLLALQLEINKQKLACLQGALASPHHSAALRAAHEGEKVEFALQAGAASPHKLTSTFGA
jgi:hypothetical protein